MLRAKRHAHLVIDCSLLLVLLVSLPLCKQLLLLHLQLSHQLPISRLSALLNRQTSAFGLDNTQR